MNTEHPREGSTSHERAARAVKAAIALLRNAHEEYDQVNRCPHDDPSGAPPLKRCVLKAGHEGIHRYPGRGLFDGGTPWWLPQPPEEADQPPPYRETGRLTDEQRAEKAAIERAIASLERRWGASP